MLTGLPAAPIVRIGLVCGGKAVAQRDVGAVADADEAGVGVPDRGFSDDVVGQAVNFRVGTRDPDVPGPVVVADLLLHPIRNGGEDTAAQDKRLFINRTGLNTTNVVVVPVDVALDRPVPTKDEAVALGSPGVLVEASPDVALYLVVRHDDVTIVLGPHIQLLLVPRKPIDLQFLRLEQAERTSNSDFLWFSTSVSSIVKREVFQSVSVAMIAVSALLPRWYVASGFVLTGNPWALAYSCASQIAGRSSCTPSPTAPNAS